jgi:hypothetical protein
MKERGEGNVTDKFFSRGILAALKNVAHVNNIVIPSFVQR